MEPADGQDHNDALKTLDEFNEARVQEHEALNRYPHPNGIACPQCGAELMDTNPYVLSSNPPKKNVHCEKCGWKGYRAA